jgi:hypothetical protein
MKPLPSLKDAIIRDAITTKSKIFDLLTSSSEGTGNQKYGGDNPFQNNTNVIAGNYTFIKEEIINLPIGEESQTVTEFAKRIDGSPTNLLISSSDANKFSMEICLHAVNGQIFGTAYPGTLHNGQVMISSTCGYLSKRIDLLPGTDRVIVTSELFIPKDMERVCYFIPGNFEENTWKMYGYAAVYLNAQNADGRVIGSNFISHIPFINFENEAFKTYNDRITINSTLNIPEGTAKLSYMVMGVILVSCDRIFRDVSDLDPQKFGFAFIDLRGKYSGSQYPVLIDPLSPAPNPNAPGPGGIRVYSSIASFQKQSNFSK